MRKNLLFVLLAILSLAGLESVKAQNPSGILSLRNFEIRDTLGETRIYEFDVYLSQTGSTAFELAGCQLSMIFKNSLLNGGTPSVTYVTGTSGLLTSQIPTNPNSASTVTGYAGQTYRVLKLSAKAPPGAGSGSIIPSGTGTTGGVRVGRFRIFNSVAFAIAKISTDTITFVPGYVVTNVYGYASRISAYVNSINTDISTAAVNAISYVINQVPVYSPDVTITSPVAGTVWKLGNNGTVSWTGTASAVNIIFSSNGGNTWDTVGKNIATGLGSYSFKLNYNYPSANCKLKVIESTGAYGDSLTSNFSMSGPKVSLGLSAFFPFAGNANDSVNNSYTGSVVGAVLTNDRFNRANNAYRIPSADAFILVNTDSLLRSQNAVTISGWFKPLVSSANGVRLIKNANTQGYQFYWNNADNFLQFKFDRGVSPLYVKDTTSNSRYVGTWHYLVGSYDSSIGAKFYVDGKLVSSSAGLGKLTYDGTQLLIGTGIPTQEFFNGIVDDIRLYNRAITAAEVDTLFREGGWTGKTLQLVTPNGGESYANGTLMNITWYSYFLDKIKIQITSNNGTSWQTIADSISADLNSYNWLVAVKPGANYKLRIMDVAGIMSDTSNAVFSITGSTLFVGLEAYYPFNGNANDNSGKANNGVVNGATLIAGKPGLLNSAYYFNGSSSIHFNQPFFSGGQRDTFSFYTRFKFTTAGVIWSKAFNWGEVNFEIDAGTNKAVVFWANSNDGNTYSSVSSVNPLPVNTWIDLAFVFARGTARLYVNGVEVSTNKLWVTQGGTVLSNTSLNNYCNFAQDAGGGNIGYKLVSGSPSGYFGGIIDEFRIYGRAITSEEVDSLGYIPPPQLTLTSPNGGQSFTNGTLMNISWSSTNIEKVKLQITSDNGGSWQTIVDSLTAGLNSYSWLVAVKAGTNYKLRILDLTSGLGDTSNAVFSILGQTLLVGLEAYYPFNGNANDSSGNANNGVVNGVTLTTGKYNVANTAYSFNGSSSIRVNQPFFSGSQRDSFSVFVRLKYTSAGTIWAKSFTWGDVYFEIEPATGKFAAYWSNSNSGNTYSKIVSVSAVTANTWIDLGFTFSAGTAKLYVNGAVVSSTVLWITETGTVLSSSVLNNYCNFAQNANSNNFGYRLISGSPANYFTGAIDEFRLYNRALTAEEMDSLYNDIPGITIKFPVGGESLVGNSQVNITWNSKFVSKVKLEYTTNNGTAWVKIADSADATSMSYAWSVPNLAASQAKVRITDYKNASLSSTSPAVFAISQYPNPGPNPNAKIILSLRNGAFRDTLGATRIYEFDVYLSTKLGYTNELAGCQLGMVFKNSVLNGGTPTATYIAGTSGLLPAQIPANPNASLTSTYYNSTSYRVLRVAAKAPPGAGAGTIIAVGDANSGGTRVGRFRIFNSVAFLSGNSTSDSITFSPGNYTGTIPYSYACKISTYENSVNTDISNAANNLVSYEYASIINPLPVELNTFTAKTGERGIILNWSTATEVNSYKFVIERSLVEVNSPERIWQSIAEIAASGSSNSIREYTYTDRKLQAGKYVYRLIMIDNDGSYEYSKIEAEATVGTPKEFTLSQNYPNPFNPTTRIEYSVPADAGVRIDLYSTTGERITSLLNTEVTGGYYTYDINASQLGLSTGMYLYRVTIINKQTGEAISKAKKMMLVK